MNFINYVNYQKDLNEKSKIFLIKNWKIGEGIFKKVDIQGNYIDFFGNTVLIFLEKEEIDLIEKIQNKLYSKIGNLLARPLTPRHFMLLFMIYVILLLQKIMFHA
ncbi:hypothetical protein [Marinitoga lauensis]|uniref:hypothetical protein n=1 Tax=Marinitoga lauensis TaxID=2201189 RepID=UPI0010112E81|nr:hypothetical protein [Marinitoga lauensis]